MVGRQAKRREVLCGLGVSLTSVLLPSRALAADPKAEEKLRPYWVMVEPDFLRPEMGMTVEGGKHTFFVPGREIAGYPGIEAYRRVDFDKLRISWDAFYAKASLEAARWLLTLEPEYIKDHAGRAKYAVIRSEKPLVSGLVTASNFVSKFRKLLGPNLVVFVPDRQSIYVFPEKVEVYSEYALAMHSRYTEATYSCSREVFLWREGMKKPRIVGVLGE